MNSNIFSLCLRLCLLKTELFQNVLQSNKSEIIQVSVRFAVKCLAQWIKQVWGHHHHHHRLSVHWKGDDMLTGNRNRKPARVKQKEWSETNQQSISSSCSRFLGSSSEISFLFTPYYLKSDPFCFCSALSQSLLLASNMEVLHFIITRTVWNWRLFDLNSSILDNINMQHKMHFIKSNVMSYRQTETANQWRLWGFWWNWQKLWAHSRIIMIQIRENSSSKQRFTQSFTQIKHH